MAKKGTKVSVTQINGNQIQVRPLMVSDASDSPMIPSARQNDSATNLTRNGYTNLRQGIFPYNRQSVGMGIQTISIQEAVELCQLAWYNFSLFRTAIDTMTDLANSEISLIGGNVVSKAFITKWFEKINIWDIGDQFFREYFRSSNVFIYRFDGDFSKDDKKKFMQVFAANEWGTPFVNNDLGQLDPSTKIPLRYMFLNPTFIRATPNINFGALTYYQALTMEELARLQNPKTPEDVAVIRNLGPEAVKQIKQGGVPLILLNPKQLSYVFNNKQDYEPFAIPWGWPVLKDIESKLELKKMDAAIARTCELAILLITMGESPKDGGLGVNPEALQTMQSIFQSDSVKKVLVADFTTKGQWLIPDLNKVLGPAKYVELDKDIQEGLNMILIGDEKLGNTQAKVAVFCERLNKARRAFSRWLQTEIRVLCKNMSFKVVPEVYFQDINLQNPIEYAKLYAQMMSIGILTAEEGIEAINNGKLPTPQESVESQTAYKSMRGKMLYQPLVGAGTGQNAGGRPTGTTGPKSQQKVSAPGTKQTMGYSMAKIIELIKLSDSLKEEIQITLLKKTKTKTLNEQQNVIASILLKNIIANEKPENWLKKVYDYTKEPKEIEESIASKIDNISIEHNLEFNIAALLSHAEKEME